MQSRRMISFGLMGSLLTSGGCTNEANQSSASTAATTDPLPRIVKPTQCLIGLPDAPKTTLLAVSLHCDASRAYIRENRERLRNALLYGDERILLTHLARTENEVPVAVELLRVDARDYSTAMLAALSLAARIDAPLSLEHVRLLISERGFRRNTAESENDLRLSVFGTRRLFTEVEGITETPYIKDLTT